MTFFSVFTTTRSSPMLALLISMLICSFLHSGSATVLLQRDAAPLKECLPFTCMLEGLDVKCKVQTEMGTTETTCGQMMQDICEKVEENDRKYMEECHEGMHTEGKECSKCEAASKMCRSVLNTDFDKLQNNVRSATMGVSKILREEDQVMLQKLTARGNIFVYRGGGSCIACFGDNSDG